jgi:hypothetical protein
MYTRHEIIIVVKSKSMRWIGHAARMIDTMELIHTQFYSKTWKERDSWKT